MARIKFIGRETRRGALPMLCMVCGEDAVTRLRRRFTWHRSRPEAIAVRH